MKNKDFTFKNNQVFYGKSVLKGMVAENFDVLYSYNDKVYLKDVKGIWWFNRSLKRLVKFITSDVANFTVINDKFSKDSKSVYEALFTFKKIPNADPETFQIVQDDKIPNIAVFYKDKNQCYAMSSVGEGLIIIDDADPETFGGCSWNRYAVDKDHLFNYYHVVEIENELKYSQKLDSRILDEDWEFEKTFELNKMFLMEKYPHIKGWWHPDYSKNISLNDVVYDKEYNNKDLLEISHEIDKKPPFYHQNNDTIFYCFYEMYQKEVVLKTFKVMAKIIPTLIRGVDLPSFKQLNAYYAKDKNHVYFKHKKVLAIDVKSAKIVSRKFIKDKHNYFYNGQPVANIDYDSFKVYELDEYNDMAIDNFYFFHRKHKRISKFGGYEYFMEPLISYDKESFTKLSDRWSKDKDNIYFEHTLFASTKVDVNTFRVLGNFTPNDDNSYLIDSFSLAIDKNHLYFCERPYQEKVIDGIDGDSFKVLNSFWGKDKNVVVNFEKKKIMKAIDAETFEIIDANGKAQDKGYVYEYIVPKPPKHLQNDVNLIKMYSGFFPELKKKKRKQVK